jgi:hypothetical protein
MRTEQFHQNHGDPKKSTDNEIWKINSVVVVGRGSFGRVLVKISASKVRRSRPRDRKRSTRALLEEQREARAHTTPRLPPAFFFLRLAHNSWWCRRPTPPPRKAEAGRNMPTTFSSSVRVCQFDPLLPGVGGRARGTTSESHTHHNFACCSFSPSLRATTSERERGGGGVERKTTTTMMRVALLHAREKGTPTPPN